MRNVAVTRCTFHLAVLVVTGVAGRAHAGLILWDNGLEPNGIGLRDVSPPAAPLNRAADDFRVQHGWPPLTGVEWVAVEDPGWVRGSRIEVNIYQDRNGEPGEVHRRRVTRHWTAIDTGQRYFDRDAYLYVVSFNDIALEPGNYWIGFRMPDASGRGTNYWLSSNGGTDGSGSSTGFFSDDGGDTWTSECWHYAYQLTGVPAPGALGVLVVGSVLTARRRRHASSASGFHSVGQFGTLGPEVVPWKERP